MDIEDSELMWKDIDDDCGGYGGSSYLLVPGGMIIRSHMTRYQGGTSISQTFVPDPPKEITLKEMIDDAG